LKDVAFEKKLEGSALTRENVCSLLEEARAICLSKQSDYAPVDARAIRAFAAPRAAQVNSLSSLANALSVLKPLEVERSLQGFISPEFKALVSGEDSKDGEEVGVNAAFLKKRDATPLAWACFLNVFYEKLFRNEASVSKYAVSNASVGPCMLAVDFDSWRVVKKALAGAEAKEVFYFLATSFLSIDKKLSQFVFDGAQAQQFSLLSDSFLKNFGERKSFSKLQQMLSRASSEGVEAKLTALSSREPHLALQLFLDRVFEYSGFAPFATVDALNSAFPELKIPKPRGRIAGSKK